MLLPSGGKSNLRAFESVKKQVLDKAIWGVQFYMLADRDAQPSGTNSKDLEESSKGKFRTLGKYHLENYFLDSNVLASCFKQMEEDDSWLRNPQKIEEELKNIATGMTGYTVSLITSKAIRDAAGNIDVMLKGSHECTKENLVENLVAKSAEESTRITNSLKEAEVKEIAEKPIQK